MTTKLVLATFAICCLATACSKTKITNKEPVIVFEDMTPNRISPNSQDSLSITFKITDGDGDLGNDVQSGNHDIYLVDTRVNQTNPYFFPEFDRDAVHADQGITAHCTVKVSAALFLQMRTDTPAHKLYDTLQYKIYVKDRAGHTSDTIMTPQIYLY